MLNIQGEMQIKCKKCDFKKQLKMKQNNKIRNNQENLFTQEEIAAAAHYEHENNSVWQKIE